MVFGSKTGNKNTIIFKLKLVEMTSKTVIEITQYTEGNVKTKAFLIEKSCVLCFLCPH